MSYPLVINPGKNIATETDWRIDYFREEYLKESGVDVNDIPDFARVSDQFGETWISISAMSSDGLWENHVVAGTITDIEVADE